MVLATTGTTMDTITSSLTTALSGVKDDALEVIAAALPYALAIMGAVVVISVGLRIFKKFAK